MLINASPEPFSNWAASITEDVAVVAGVWAAASHPIVFLVALVLFMAALIWLIPRIWRALRRMLGAIARFFRGGPQTTPDPPGDAPLPPPR
jgi:hypothetical protein